MALTVQNGSLVVRDGALGTGQGCCCNNQPCSGPCDEENPCPEGCRCNYEPGQSVGQCVPVCSCDQQQLSAIAASVGGTYSVEAGHDCSGVYEIPSISLAFVPAFGGYHEGSVSFELSNGSLATATAYLFCEAGPTPRLFRADLNVTHGGCLVRGNFVGQGVVFYPGSQVVNGVCKPISFSQAYDEGNGMTISANWTFS